MRRKKQIEEEVSGGAPAYIVTFSDMITLLLTFFVMLLSLAKEQNAALFKVGQCSFKQALADFGLQGFMISRSSGQNFDYAKAQYKVDHKQDEENDRSIDSQTEMVRRIILDLEKVMKIAPSQINCISKTFEVTNIRFDKGDWKLDNSAKRFLTNYANRLTESFSDQSITLYVVGLAGSEDSAEQEYLVSAQRARIVAEFIKQYVPDHAEWSVYSWGAGPGGDWAGTHGFVSKKSQIAIAVLSEAQQ